MELCSSAVLDEADYLGDSVAILQAPGKLLALDNPVGLKHRLGKGFTLAIAGQERHGRLVEDLRRDFPQIRSKGTGGQFLLSTGSNNVTQMRMIVERIQREGGDVRYQVNSSTLEDVFLDLNANPTRSEQPESSTSTLAMAAVPDIAPAETKQSDVAEPSGEKDLEIDSAEPARDGYLALTPGHKPTYLLAIPIDAWTIVRKRLINLRRAWLLPLVAIVMVIAATCIPLFFLGNRAQTCALLTRERIIQPLTYPRSPYPLLYPPLLVSPANALGDYTPVFGDIVDAVPDNATFVEALQQNQKKFTFGGVSLSSDASAQSLFAWEGTAVRNKGLSALNLLSNQLLNRISPVGADVQEAFRLNLQFQFLPSPSFLSTAQAMKWIAFL